MDAWTDAMLRGDFEAAWKTSDHVLQRRLRNGETSHALPRHWQWLWDGRDLAGAHVLVHCYHGLGDTLQFVRLLPLLRERCAAITLWLQPALTGLLRSIPGVDRIEPLHDGAPEITRDADVELMELPHILRLTQARIPARVPYPGLEFPRAQRDPHRPLRVGLCWRSGDWNHARSIPESALLPLARMPDVQWSSLQYPPREAPFAMDELACRDLREQARRMCTLDLVISVDTLAAHLAGALGLPTWTLLPADCDWRWMHARDDSPWYPTMRLFRQARAGEWADVIEDVARALDAGFARGSSEAMAFRKHSRTLALAPSRPPLLAGERVGVRGQTRGRGEPLAHADSPARPTHPQTDRDGPARLPPHPLTPSLSPNGETMAGEGAKTRERA